MSDLALRVEGLSKSFRLGRTHGPGGVADVLENIVKRFSGSRSQSAKGDARGRSTDSDVFWALQDVSFDVQRGEVLGFIGRNGAGKSTLLKLLSRIMYPTRGRIEIHGCVRSLLEVGTGFHQDLTGRENIFLNGAILGMSRAEIVRKFDEIVSFSEVERFLDTPVKHYSSGIYVRLAFAVAAHLEPDILIVDEVLAVGDAAFQQKCMGKMGAVSRQGKTVLIVSHSLPILTSLCQRAVFLEGGRVINIGTAAEMVRQYMANVRSAPGEVTWPSLEDAPGNEQVRLHSVTIVQEGKDGSTADVEISKDIAVQIRYWNMIPEQQLYVSLWLKDGNGTFVLATSSHESISSTSSSWSAAAQSDGFYEATCIIPGNFLNEGRYVISVIIGVVPAATVILQESVLSFDVHDTGVMHEEFVGNWAGPVIRPRLPWNTVQLPANAGVMGLILAGGMGTRLKDVRPDCPKPLIPCAGLPFIEWVLRYFQRAGIQDFVVSLGHLAETAQRYFDQRDSAGLRIWTVVESQPLGTAGAVRYACGDHPNRDVLVLNGDSLLLADFRSLFDLWRQTTADALVVGVPQTDASRYGTLTFNDDKRLVSFDEKRPGAGLINAGIYLFRASLIATIPPDMPLSLERDLFPEWLRTNRDIRVCVLPSPFLDIGLPASLASADDFLRRNWPKEPTP